FGGCTGRVCASGVFDRRIVPQKAHSPAATRGDRNERRPPTGHTRPTTPGAARRPGTLARQHRERLAGRAHSPAEPRADRPPGTLAQPPRGRLADRARSPGSTGSGSPAGHTRRRQREATADRALSPGTCAALGQALVKTTVTS